MHAAGQAYAMELASTLRHRTPQRAYSSRPEQGQGRGGYATTGLLPDASAMQAQAQAMAQAQAQAMQATQGPTDRQVCADSLAVSSLEHSRAFSELTYVHENFAVFDAEVYCAKSVLMGGEAEWQPGEALGGEAKAHGSQVSPAQPPL